MPLSWYRTHALCVLLFLTKSNLNATFQSHERLRHQVEILLRLTTGVETLLRAYSQTFVWFLTFYYCSAVAPCATALSVTHIYWFIFLLLVYERRVSSVLCQSVQQIMLLLWRQLRSLDTKFWRAPSLSLVHFLCWTWPCQALGM